jgi:hypothetical protein
MQVVRNLADHLQYVVKNVDAVVGKWPLEATFYNADGKSQNLKLEDQAHAISELFAALKVVAEDADGAVNMLVRLAAELTQTRVTALQTSEIAKANAAFLGYNGKAENREIRLQFTPSAAGIDKKLQNDEMAAFLTPSKQRYIGWSYQGKTDALAIMMRTLESGEIARAALFRPVSKNGSLTGDHAKKSKAEEKKRDDAEMKKFQEDLKKQGFRVRVRKGIKKKGDNTP